jgi:hypothetical protein
LDSNTHEDSDGNDDNTTQQKEACRNQGGAFETQLTRTYSNSRVSTFHASGKPLRNYGN